MSGKEEDDVEFVCCVPNSSSWNLYNARGKYLAGLYWNSHARYDGSVVYPKYALRRYDQRRTYTSVIRTVVSFKCDNCGIEITKGFSHNGISFEMLLNKIKIIKEKQECQA